MLVDFGNKTRTELFLDTQKFSFYNFVFSYFLIFSTDLLITHAVSETRIY